MLIAGVIADCVITAWRWQPELRGLGNRQARAPSDGYRVGWPDVMSGEDIQRLAESICLCGAPGGITSAQAPRRAREKWLLWATAHGLCAPSIAAR
jgi:hypothetical protein